jgi:hypothetical protein
VDRFLFCVVMDGRNASAGGVTAVVVNGEDGGKVSARAAMIVRRSPSRSQRSTGRSGCGSRKRKAAREGRL